MFTSSSSSPGGGGGNDPDGRRRFPSLPSVLGGPLFQLLTAATAVSLAVGAVGTLWLLASLLFGNYGEFVSASKDAQAAALGNISLAQALMGWGFGVGSVLCTLVYLGEEVLGYALLIGALFVGFGIPSGFQQFGGEAYAADKSAALARVFGAFASGARFPALVGALLVGYDVVGRLARTFRGRPAAGAGGMTAPAMSFGAGAQRENEGRPARTSPLGKCWEGPFCRDFIRPHCPVFLKRQACWQQKSGCYCEEDIVSRAAAKVTGKTLPMAGSNSRFASAPAAAANDINAIPDPLSSGFQMIGVGASGVASGIGNRAGSTPTLSPTAAAAATAAARRMELTPGQKRERCRGCVIYNEHQREKYQLLLPAVLIGTLLVCGYAAVQYQANTAAVIDGIELVINRFSFVPGGGKVRAGAAGTSPAVAWAFVCAATVVVLSKALQLLEWCVFKIKI